MNPRYENYLLLIEQLENDPSEYFLSTYIEDISNPIWMRELAASKLVDIKQNCDPEDIFFWAAATQPRAKSNILWQTIDQIEDMAKQACHEAADRYAAHASSVYLPYFGGN